MHLIMSGKVCSTKLNYRYPKGAACDSLICKKDDLWRDHDFKALGTGDRSLRKNGAGLGQVVSWMAEPGNNNKWSFDSHKTLHKSPEYFVGSVLFISCATETVSNVQPSFFFEPVCNL